MSKTLKPIPMWLAAGLLLAFGQAAAAAPITIDFEDLRVDDGLIRFIGSSYTSNGFTFAASVPSTSGNTPGFISMGTASTSFAGSTSLANLNGMGGTTLTRSNGSRFNLYSIDLAETPNFDPFGNPVNLGSFPLTFFGTRANGSIVQATAMIGPFPAVTTFAFRGFTNLVSVQWFQGGGGLTGGLTQQFDNVRVMAVPEPSTLLLISGGVLALRAGSRRRRRRYRSNARTSRIPSASRRARTAARHAGQRFGGAKFMRAKNSRSRDPNTKSAPQSAQISRSVLRSITRATRPAAGAPARRPPRTGPRHA